ncbi:hypothetical protein ACSLBF_04490 [Pseudoalteromonas sp. T1lg65]|uniref:hypothetical protein n=1 Tax=Pseudoalteromonas sp. T1lg65 TaxID=2077101 RepID=UPI003F79BEFB
MKQSSYLIVLSCALLMACKANGDQGLQKPATLSEASDIVQQEVARFIGQTSASPVPALDSGLFTQSSNYFVKSNTGDMHRDLGAIPDAYQLVKIADECIVVHKNSGHTVTLSTQDCKVQQ